MSTRNEDADAFVAPAGSRPREITIKAVILGVLLSVVLSAANAYLGLKVGMTVSASIPAAVISMAIFRFFRQSSLVENNIVQTAASAGESLAAGMIFTLPALILLGYWADFPYLPVVAITMCGGVLGVLFTVPLRRALIVEKPLRFPEGVATGEVLKAGKAEGKDARFIALAGLAGGVLKFCQTGLGVAASSVSGAVKAGGAVLGFGSELGVALLGVGYIVGINIAVLVFAGGALAWFVAIPLYMLFTDPAQLMGLTEGASGYAAAEAVWEERVRYLGVGAMAVGGVWALLVGRMDGTGDLLNVVDVEATCWEGAPPDGAVSEIIEIGLTVVDLGSGKRVARHGVPVRPERSAVSSFCTELTGLTQDQVDQGLGFASACRLLAAEYSAATRPWTSWGDYDRKQFERQCRASATPYPFDRRHTNAKRVFAEAHGLRRRPGMDRALEIAGLPLEGRHHRGEDDAWNIAALVLSLAERGVWPAPEAG